jgi:hypothetical protein
MNKQIVIKIFFILFIASCSPKQSQVQAPLINIRTNLKNYPAAAEYLKGRSDLQEGFNGIVKIFVEHGFEDATHTTGTYEAEGTGSVFVNNHHIYIITAKHVIVPSHEIKSIIIDPKDSSKKINFGKIVLVGSRVSIGKNGNPPSVIWFSADSKLDVAILEISDSDNQSLIINPLDASIDPDLLRDPKSVLTPGLDADIWGFPSTQSPQMEKLNITDINSQFFVLNRALSGGYSGGIVIFSNNNMEKSIAGMVIRSDSQSNQSTSIPWNAISTVFDAVLRKSDTVFSIISNEKVEVDGVPYLYSDYYDFPFKTTIPKSWWEFWKSNKVENPYKELPTLTPVPTSTLSK